MPQTQSNNPLLSRQAKLHNILQSASLHSLVLNPGPSLVYLTGLHFHLSERPVLVIFSRQAIPCIVLPKLELQKLTSLPFDLQAFPYPEDPSQWAQSFHQAAQFSRLEHKRNGVEPGQIRLLEYHLLIDAAPHAEYVPAETSVANLRMYKNSGELSAMRKAVDIAQLALEATLPRVKIGITERELASELTLQLLHFGCDSQVPFAPIVSSGPNSANPHAVPTDRKLASGDLLVIDWGASFNGYFSDLTRTFAIGNVEPELLRIHDIVLTANSAGRDAAQPGIPAEQVDQAARAVIDTSGYGQYFTHRTGHGLGMEGHEHPYIRSGNHQLLESGMTFTIEPGIYLPGRNGVRIEDDVVITSTGVECLSSFPREFKQLG